MNLGDYLLGMLSVYGSTVLFGALVIGCVGVPLPATLMLIAAGSFVEQGDLNQWGVLVLASAGAILGDNIGYALGRWGGHHMARRLSSWVGGENRLREAVKWSEQWGGAGIFLSRWLLTPLGPWVNLISGITGYPWHRFLFFDVTGEVLWVVLYVMLGRFFSNQVQTTQEVFGDFTWLFVGLLAAALLGWQLIRYLRPVSLPKAEKDKILVKDAT